MPTDGMSAQLQATYDIAAQSNLRTALITAKAVYATEGSYAGVQLSGPVSDPSVSFSEISATSGNAVGVAGNAQSVLLVAVSESGTAFCIAEEASSQTQYGTGATLDDVSSFTECLSAPAW